jgi:hypothetical protein
LFEFLPKLIPAILCISLLPFHASAQTAKQPANDSSSSDARSQSEPPLIPKTTQPGELGSPFKVDHFWNHVALELGGGYTPVLKEGAGYFNKGFNVTVGVIDHFNDHWAILAEAQIFGLTGSKNYIDFYGNPQSSNKSNTDFAFDLDVNYDFFSRARTSPYIIGGAGYYYFGLINQSDINGGGFNTANAAEAAGYDGGIGIRHRLYAGKRMELFSEGRYHYIASGSTDFGQLSLLPISAGIRW